MMHLSELTLLLSEAQQYFMTGSVVVSAHLHLTINYSIEINNVLGVVHSIF